MSKPVQLILPYHVGTRIYAWGGAMIPYQPKPIMVEIVGYSVTRYSFSVQVKPVSDRPVRRGVYKRFPVASSFGYLLYDTYDEGIQVAKNNNWRLKEE